MDYDSLYALSKLPVVNPTITLARRIMAKPLILLLRLYLVRVTYFKMGTITNKNSDFLKDTEFLNAYNAAMKQQNMPDTDTWRYHVNQWAVSYAKTLEGDFVECGVYRGSTAMSNIVYTNFGCLNKKYYLFDTFKGLDSCISTKEECKREKAKYPECYDFVVNSFKPFPNVIIVRGTVPYSLPQVNINKVAYLSLDMNCALPEQEALKYFWNKIVKGGIIILDDYGYPMCEQQKKVADDFALSVGTKILSLPNGQGVIIK